jgi:POT family proton-dependent oligopeptide transporter
MLAGLIQFYLGQDKIIQEDMSKKTKRLNFSDWRSVVFLSLINIPIILLIFEINGFINDHLYELLTLSFTLVLIIFLKQKNKINFIKDDIKKVFYISILSLFVIFFWVGFEQAGGSLTLYASNSVDRNLFGFIIPASFFQSINPLIIILLGPLIANFWLRIDNSDRKINTSQKMGIGLILLSAGFFLIMYVNNSSDSSISLWWLVGVYFLHTLGELCLSPIGLSMVTKVSPKKIASLMMGFWFLSAAIANYSAGKLPSILQTNNLDLFTFLTIMSLTAGIVLIAIAPFMEKLVKK